MKTYTASELAEIIKKHGKWLRGEEGGKSADLSHSDLRGSDLRGSNLRGSDLSYSDLSYSDLSYSDLSYSDLSCSDLSCSDLSGSNLSCSKLSYSDLSGSNLSCSKLSYSDLSYSDLRGSKLSCSDLLAATGNMSEIKSLQCDLWPVTYTADKMQIGCQFHTLAGWWEFSDLEIQRMDSQALAWWAIWKPILQKIVEVSPAKPGRTEGDN